MSKTKTITWLHDRLNTKLQSRKSMAQNNTAECRHATDPTMPLFTLSLDGADKKKTPAPFPKFYLPSPGMPDVGPKTAGQLVHMDDEFQGVTLHDRSWLSLPPSPRSPKPPLLFRRRHTTDLPRLLIQSNVHISQSVTIPGVLSARHSAQHSARVSTVYGHEVESPECLTSPAHIHLSTPFTPFSTNQFTEKSSVLTLQTRLERALEEIRDLQHHLESLQTQLEVKTEQLSNRISNVTIMQRTALQMEEQQQQQQQRPRKEEDREVMPRKSCLHCSDEIVRVEELPTQEWGGVLAQGLFVLALLMLIVMALIVLHDMLPLSGQTLWTWQAGRSQNK